MEKRYSKTLDAFTVSVLYSIDFMGNTGGNFYSRGSWTVIVKNFILAISPAQLWFYPCFSGSIWYFIFSVILLRGCQFIPFWHYMLFCILGSCFLNRYVPLNIFQISVSIEYLLYYYMGFLFRRANVAKNSRMKDCAVLISAFILEVIFYCFGFK